MIEAALFWNEPNNKSHWDFENLDPDWQIFSDMIACAGQAVAAVNPQMTRVLGGMSPIDAGFVQRMETQGALANVDAVAVHGFPLDWNPWMLDDWPAKIDEIKAVTDKPVWVTEVGVSTFGAQEVQEFGFRRTAELLVGRAPRIHWYSLYDLPKAWPATTRHKEAEGSSYYRHFHMGLLEEDGTPKLAARHFSEFAPAMGLCQWFHYEDHRLDDAVRIMREMGVRHVRTGLSWADSFRPNALDWFDRQMSALEEFEVTATFCFTPEHRSLALARGLEPHHTSPPLVIEEYADFCAQMIRRYAPGQTLHAAASNAAAPAL